jgi:flagellum-specific ATP synthase|uniref:FliI/YscN family ATPase n=1 Tax=Desulfobacca acetoxidans TaxID=60893 RepID=A0A7C3YZE2_9BACT
MSRPAQIDWQYLQRALRQTSPYALTGRVQEMVGLVITSRGPECAVGRICEIEMPPPEEPMTAEVVGFRQGEVLLMPQGEVRGIRPQARVTLQTQEATANVGGSLLGRVLDGLGRPLDDRGVLNPSEAYPLYAKPLNPVAREKIREPLDVGIRAINGLLTLGRGQRVGIFAGSGVGKSTLLGMMARYTRSDVSVIALIGERGREVKEFLDHDLGEEGLARSCVVAATSDSPPLARLRGAYLATAIAEYFRDQGLHVLLLMDSLTRFAMAAREIGLAIGEPPTARGYTPSVFTRLPGLLERAGACRGKGSITGIYTVLVEGDDLLEPIADATRAILDGHIVLSRELADRGHYPAIDILGSISRLMPQVAKPEHLHLRENLVRVLAAYRRAEDLVNINAYVRGSNPEIDYALDKIEAVNRYLRQGTEESISLDQAIKDLETIFLS